MTRYTSDGVAALLHGLELPPGDWIRKAERIPRARGHRSGGLTRSLFRPAVAPVTAHAAEPLPDEDELPAFSLRRADLDRIRVRSGWPDRVGREWAWEGSTGLGVRVCVIDSGIDGNHPLVAPLEGAVAVSLDEHGETQILEDDGGDLCGHGTACASVVRAVAPECSLFSVKVLGAGMSGSGAVLVAGLRWALEQGFDVINLSLSTTRRDFGQLIHDLADDAYFQRATLVASAHNLAVESYPWRFSSLISVGSHQQEDPFAFFYNPEPPVEFFARGVDVRVAWLHGKTLPCTGNSFATPHLAGICALILAKHPELRPFQLKSLLYLTATNVGEG